MTNDSKSIFTTELAIVATQETKSWNYTARFKIVFKLSSVLIDLFHNNNYGRKQQAAKEEAFIGTSEEMIDLMENESRGIP